MSLLTVLASLNFFSSLLMLLLSTFCLEIHFNSLTDNFFYQNRIFVARNQGPDFQKILGKILSLA